MNVTETLLRECAARGVRLSASVDRLRVEVSDSLRFDDLLDNLRAHKPDLLAVLKGSSWQPESDADIAKAVKEAEDERAAILEFEGGLPRAEAQARAYAWHWKSEKYDPLTGTYGGTYICPHADPETVRRELEAGFGGRVTELHRWDRTSGAAVKLADGYEPATPSTAWPPARVYRELESMAGTLGSARTGAGDSGQACKTPAAHLAADLLPSVWKR